MQLSISGQTRTPSALKWMLNERAAVAGRIAQESEQLQSLNARMATLRRRLEKLERRAAATESRLKGATAARDGLDRAIALMYQEARPDAAGVVNAWGEKYGKRGELKAFLVQMFKTAAPAPVSSSQIFQATLERFGHSVANFQDRGALRRSLKNAVQRIHRAGLIEPLHPRQTKSPGLWRWKQATTLSDLAAMAAALHGARNGEANAPSSHPGGFDPPNSNPSGHQVDAQRACGVGG